MPKFHHGRSTRETSPAPQRAKLPEAPARAAASLQCLSPSAIVQRAMAYPHPLRPAELMAMQRTLGNRAVGAMLGRAPIQAKLIVNAPGDQYEREADRVAEQVMRMPAPPREALPRPENSPEVITKPASQHGGNGSFAAGEDFADRLQASQGRGRPLPPALRETFETGFGADFSSVRVHSDAAAGQLSQAIQAQAFTRGSDIFLGTGQSAAATTAGQRLLAHELTHVVQQGAAPLKTAATPQRVTRPRAASSTAGRVQREDGDKTGSEPSTSTGHDERGLLGPRPPPWGIEKFSNPSHTPSGPGKPMVVIPHKRSDQPLFPHAPTQADIVQGNLGDCFLLSALVSILDSPNGPTTIEKSMLDLGREVIVRLYDQNLVPRYISVSKDVVVGMGADILGVGANVLWVKLFEKAYAALFKNNSYVALDEGGTGTDALSAILGAEAERRPLRGHSFSFTELMFISKESPKKMIERVTREVFGGREDLTAAWMDWYTQEKYELWRGNERSEQGRYVRRARLRSFIEDNGAPAEVVDWINKNKQMLPGFRGSGLYSAAQLEIFDTIAVALARGRPVTVASKIEIAAKGKIIGHGQAGEGKAKSGLVGKHVYSVLNTRKDEGLRWVQLHNPWNKWGVRYERGFYEKGLKKGRRYLRPVADPGAGTFWLELDDLTKRFKEVSTAGAAVRLPSIPQKSPAGNAVDNEFTRWWVD
jgi:hypothetical protein